jgi:hypothetical protein
LLHPLDQICFECPALAQYLGVGRAAAPEFVCTETWRRVTTNAVGHLLKLLKVAAALGSVVQVHQYFFTELPNDSVLFLDTEFGFRS